MEIPFDTEVMKHVDASSVDRFRLSGDRFDDYSHVIYEGIDGMPDSMPHDDLSSFRPQKALNEKVWIGGLINSRVRLRLLDIADDFIEFLGIGWAEYDDIILTGSLANYNWSRYSDFDVHILYDFSEIDERTEFVKEYVDAKKNEWNGNHDSLRIYGFPVEMYVQDSREEHMSSGIYSLERNEWIRKPESDRIKAIKLDKYLIKEKVLRYVRKIDELQDIIELSGDEHKVEEAGKKIHRLFVRMKADRKTGLAEHGEMSVGNVVYKMLRRIGYIDRIFELNREAYDKIKSIS